MKEGSKGLTSTAAKVSFHAEGEKKKVGSLITTCRSQSKERKEGKS
jgi:hypothetical protein